MERDVSRDLPASASARKMLGYVSGGLYERSYVGKWIFEVMGIEHDAAWRIVRDLPEQLFAEAATWGLAYHEMKWGLPVRKNLSYEERRRLIRQKRDYRAPMTPYRMERLLEAMTGLEVHVNDAHDKGRFGAEFPDPNVFAVTVIGDSSLDLSGVRAELDRMKQSHTVYTIDLVERRYEVVQCTYAAIVPQTKKTYVVEVL